MKVRVKSYKAIEKTLAQTEDDFIVFDDTMRRYCGKVIDVTKMGEADDDFCGEGWWWHKLWLDFNPKSSPIEAIIFNGRTTTVIGKDGRKYSATCADNEEWDYEKGAMAAAMRMPCRVDYRDIAPYLQH